MRLFTRLGLVIAGFLPVICMIPNPAAAEKIQLNSNRNEIKMQENSVQGFNLSLRFSEFQSMDVKTPEGVFTRLIVPDFSSHGISGSPELPVKSELIEVPAGADVRVTILNYTVKEYSLKSLGVRYPVMPNQLPVPKTGEIPEFVYNKDAYRINAFNQDEIASVELLGVLRGVNIGRLDIRPVQYNPVQGTVRIYENLEIEVRFENADFTAGEYNKLRYENQYFSPVFNTMINYTEAAAGRENFSRYPVKYVIVSDPMFEAQLQPFIEWKIKKGFTVIEAYTDDPEVGSTTYSIKSFLQGLYDNATPEDPAPTFILFVGDIDQVPTWTGQAAGHVTDLYYCEYTDDYFPEVFYGRFSATSAAQLQPQIDKTLQYEQYLMPVTSFLDTVVMIAGMDGTFGPTHANGQINYGTENYFNAAHGISSHTYLYPESGNNAALIRQNISDGVSFANYTAHGSPSGWADPSFSVSDVAAMQNEGKYGLLVGNCCSTSEYQVGECFGEALLRAANKGALGYVGASNSTYWDEDYYFGVGVGAIAGDPPTYEETTLGFYDRWFHTHGEPFGEWYTTMDQIIYAGNLAVTLGTPGSAEYYWEAYCLMGDPSVMVYMTVPPMMTVTYDPLIPLGNTTFTLDAVPYAYVGVSMNGVILGAALADSNGVAVVTLNNVPGPGNADVVVTAQDFQPYIGTVLIANPEGPYVLLNQYIIDDENGNFNGMAEFGEDIMLHAELKNWGNGDALNTHASLSTEDVYVSITDNYQEYGTIVSQDSVMEESAFEFQVDEYVPDMHLVTFNLDIQDDTRESWGSTFTVTLYAPDPAIGNMMIDDSFGGNNNGRFDEGETVNIQVDCNNNGHCDALSAIATLSSSSPYITIQTSECTFDTISWNGTRQAVFPAVLAEEIEPGVMIDLNVGLTAGAYSDNKLYNAKVGEVIEDFETGGFESFDWILSGTQPWQITQENIFEGVFSARSGIIGDEQTSVISIDVDVAIDDSISFYRKVSCEDDPYNDDYDWMGFYIDDIEIERWDGEVDWSREVYPIAAGEHTFAWIFNKDYSVSAGLDAAFLDNILFPALAPVIGVEEIKGGSRNELVILPNPAKDNTGLYITSPSVSVISVSIYDLTGNKIREVSENTMIPAGTTRISLNTGDLMPGMYFCVMTTGTDRITKKLIINN